MGNRARIAPALHKDADGEIEVQHLSNLTKEGAIELGSEVAALVGLGIEGEEGLSRSRRPVWSVRPPTGTPLPN